MVQHWDLWFLVSSVCYEVAQALCVAPAALNPRLSAPELGGPPGLAGGGVCLSRDSDVTLWWLGNSVGE